MNMGNTLVLLSENHMQGFSPGYARHVVCQGEVAQTTTCSSATRLEAAALQAARDRG